jgi:hypothetical protein
VLESFDADGHPHSETTVRSTVTFVLDLPDDPKIESILIFRPHLDRRGFYLDLVSTIKLPRKG